MNVEFMIGAIGESKTIQNSQVEKATDQLYDFCLQITKDKDSEFLLEALKLRI